MCLNDGSLQTRLIQNPFQHKHYADSVFCIGITFVLQQVMLDKAVIMLGMMIAFFINNIFIFSVFIRGDAN